MFPGALQSTNVFCRTKIALDELNQAIDIFSRHRVVLLVEIVDVAVEDLDEELDAHGCIHASVGDTKGALQAFEHALAVAVKLKNLSV